jgi:hypothetical protein
LKKKIQLKKIKFFFIITTIYISLSLHKGRPSYKKRLQLSKKRTSSTSKHEISKFFLLLWVIFALLDPDPDYEYGSGSTDPIESGSNSDPDPQPWEKQGIFVFFCALKLVDI